LTKYGQISAISFSLNDLRLQWTQYQLFYLNLFRQNSKFKSGETWAHVAPAVPPPMSMNVKLGTFECEDGYI